MILTIDNVRGIQESLGRSVVQRSRFIPDKKPREKGGLPWFKSMVSDLFDRPKYILLEDLSIQLTNGDIIVIPKGFVWDLSSVPRFLWGLFPPDGNFELASLIHDFLYKYKLYPREFCDIEMFTWSKAVAGTIGRDTLADYDNWIRYAGVRVGGWAVYYRKD